MHVIGTEEMVIRTQPGEKPAGSMGSSVTLTGR
jgi:hypothetical protein